jgi:transcriptional regulator with XRE-family HTH domain
MNSPKITKALPSSQLRTLLRKWRDARGSSQFDLSVDANLSQRHISFIEGGRSVPSRATVLSIAQALDIPLRDRNTLLLAAGYAPIYSESGWDAPEMRMVTKAVERMLHQHEPFPAIVMDRYWNVLTTNESTPNFFNCFIDMKTRKGPRNLLQLMFDPEGLRPFIANWEDVARSLFLRIYREAVGQFVDEKTEELMAGLSAGFEVKTDWEAPDTLGGLPVVPISFACEGHTLNYFSMISKVATPQMVAAEELRVECIFPADQDTERRHLAMMSNLSSSDLILDGI